MLFTGCNSKNEHSQAYAVCLMCGIFEFIPITAAKIEQIKENVKDVEKGGAS